MSNIRSLKDNNNELFYPLTHVEGLLNRDGTPVEIINDIFDVSEYNASGTPLVYSEYANLSAALQDIPSGKQKPGMTIRFIESSSHKYLQFRLMKNTWSTTESDWQGIDENPNPGSNNLITSGGVAGNIVYDISAANSGTTYSSLSDALGTNGVNVPESIRKGGMSIKYVRSSNNMYVQWRLMKNTWSTTESDWQGIDETPIPGSNNLLNSGGVAKKSLRLSRTYNLVNENDITLGYLVNTSGNIVDANGWAISHKIPVVPGTTYRISIFGTIGRGRGLAFFDSSDNSISYKDSILGTVTAPENASYMIFNMMASYIKNTEVLVIDYTEGEDLPYIPYYILDDLEISDNITRVSQIKTLEKQFGYFSCDSNYNVTNKVANAEGFSMLDISGGAIRIKFTYHNQVPSPTLNINNTGALPLYYNGSLANLGNTWDDGDILEIYLDRTGEVPVWQARDLTKQVRRLEQSVDSLIGFEIKSESISVESGQTYSNPDLLNGLSIEANELLEYMVVSDVPLSRTIVNYNGNNNKRIVDTTSDIRNKWNLFSKSENIAAFGIYITIPSNSSNGNVKLCIRKVVKIGADRIEQKCINYTLLSTEVTDNILPCTKTLNLYNSFEKIWGYYISTATPPRINDAEGWAYSGYIPVEADTDYYISAEELQQTTGFVWCDSGKNIISASGGTAIIGLHHSPANAAYMAFTVAKNGVEGRNIMVAKSNVSLPYVPYNQILSSQVKGLDDILPTIPIVNRPLKLVKNGNTITITDGVRTSVDTLERNVDNYYSSNPVFNINGGDDIAPMHILNGTYGANHSVVCANATISSHGLDNTYVGTAWVKDNVTFYIMRILDSNHIIFLSENNGSRSNPSFAPLTTGTITHDDVTLTISSVSSTQLYPGLKNHIISLYGKNVGKIVDDGSYEDDYFDIVESYDIMNLVSTLEKIIARAGSNDDPVYDGDAAVHVENVYRYTKTMTVLVITNVYALEEIVFHDIMFSQAARIGENGVVKYYVPNSLPFSNGAYDMRQPLAITWSSSINGIAISQNNVKDTRYPINRVLQYLTDNGFALGFLTTKGVGADLNSYTNYYFELRNNTGKVYPHGVNNKIGSTLQVGEIYTAVMYRSPFTPETSGNRLSMYHFDYNDEEFIYIDYKGSMLDKVIVDDSLNGKTVEVIESSNTTLKTNIYNNGFYVDASFVANETCYMVVKVH